MSWSYHFGNRKVGFNLVEPALKYPGWLIGEEICVERVDQPGAWGILVESSSSAD